MNRDYLSQGWTFLIIGLVLIGYHFDFVIAYRLAIGGAIGSSMGSFYAWFKEIKYIEKDINELEDIKKKINILMRDHYSYRPPKYPDD